MKGRQLSDPRPTVAAHSGGKSAAKAIVFACLRYSGVAFLLRHTAQRRWGTVLGYHDPDPETFERHLAVLTRLYSVVPLETLLSARRTGDLRRLPRRALAITLDDGWAGNRALLPSLERWEVRVTVFLSTAIVGTRRHYWWTHVTDKSEQERFKGLGNQERLAALAGVGFAVETEYPDRQALSIDEIDELMPFADFQAHARTHPILPRCSDDQARWEIEGSAEDIGTITGDRAQVFAYPNGDFSDRDADLVKQAGYDCAFSIDPGYFREGDDPYRLSRVYMDDAADINELVVRASGAYGILLEWLRGLRGSDSPA